jgi:hypothetical protein
MAQSVAIKHPKNRAIGPLQKLAMSALSATNTKA